MSRTMRITRVAADANGTSRFQDVEIPLSSGGTIGWLSERHPASAVIFRETDADYDYDWHCAPRRQYIVLLDGHIEITTGSGETRQFRGGDVLLVEDTTGTGHRTRTVDGRPRRSLFIAID